MRFRALVRLSGRSATGVEVPAEVVDALGGGRRPKVTVQLNGHGYRSSVAPMAGVFMLPVSAEVRAAAGVAAGDEVEVVLALDTEPRTVAVPEDLAAALAAAPGARAAFDALSYSGQRRHVLAVEDAKTAATRSRRVAKAVEELGGARPTPP